MLSTPENLTVCLVSQSDGVNVNGVVGLMVSAGLGFVRLTLTSPVGSLFNHTLCSMLPFSNMTKVVLSMRRATRSVSSATLTGTVPLTLP